MIAAAFVVSLDLYQQQHSAQYIDSMYIKKNKKDTFVVTNGIRLHHVRTAIDGGAVLLIHSYIKEN